MWRKKAGTVRSFDISVAKAVSAHIVVGLAWWGCVGEHLKPISYEIHSSADPTALAPQRKVTL